MKDRENIRVAWVIPAMDGNYWQPLLREYTELYPQTNVYTGRWPGFLPRLTDAFAVEIVGKTQVIETSKLSATGYTPNVALASPKIVSYLLKFKPNVIFAQGFSIWTILTLVFKPLGRWKVIINYDGSSPRADYRNSWLRTAQRRIMVALTDGFITNSNAGKAYLTEIINARGSKVFARPYQVADVSALFNGESKNLQQKIKQKELKHPVFLFVGQIIHRKGLSYLLNSCTILRKEGIRDYSLLILGEGVQREELETFTQEQNLEDCVQWIGKVEYDRLGAYFSSSDVFILPTLEDVWGVVVLEAMACGKPIICSQFAGAAEMVVEGENGYIFDPHQPEILAEIMLRFIKNPNLALSMSQKSLELIDKHNPKEAAKFLAKVTSSVWGN